MRTRKVLSSFFVFFQSRFVISVALTFSQFCKVHIPIKSSVNLRHDLCLCEAI